MNEKSESITSSVCAWKTSSIGYEVSLKVGTTESMPIDDSPGVNLST